MSTKFHDDILVTDVLPGFIRYNDRLGTYDTIIAVDYESKTYSNGTTHRYVNLHIMNGNGRIWNACFLTCMHIRGVLAHCELDVDVQRTWKHVVGIT